MKDKIYIYNAFGKKPTNTYVSAGMDFYIPRVDCADQDMEEIVIDALKKSYKVEDMQIDDICDAIASLLYGTEELTHEQVDQIMQHELLNIVHLYLALQSYDIEYDQMDANGNMHIASYDALETFFYDYLVFDKNKDMCPGVCLRAGDTMFINSGIKMALHENEAGLYVNKSGMGNRGWDVRAQLVDEDYAGYVHLSLAFTKHSHDESLGTVYCGDKVTQMMILEVKHYDVTETTKEEYDSMMSGSERGDSGFGHSDVKH